MDLYVLRHGLATDPVGSGAKSDSERTLTEEGRRKVRSIAKAMREMELSFDLILTSPYARARETSEIVAEKLDLMRELEFSDHLIPGGSARKLVDFINDLKGMPRSLMLVGHEPWLSQFIALLTSNDAGLSLNLKKGGFAKVRVGVLRHGKCAVLEWLLTPGQMKLMR